MSKIKSFTHIIKNFINKNIVMGALSQINIVFYKMKKVKNKDLRSKLANISSKSKKL